MTNIKNLFNRLKTLDPTMKSADENTMEVYEAIKNDFKSLDGAIIKTGIKDARKNMSKNISLAVETIIGKS